MALRKLKALILIRGPRSKLGAFLLSKNTIQFLIKFILLKAYRISDDRVSFCFHFTAERSIIIIEMKVILINRCVILLICVMRLKYNEYENRSFYHRFFCYFIQALFEVLMMQIDHKWIRFLKILTNFISLLLCQILQFVLQECSDN